MAKQLNVVSLDAELENSDWTKWAWDLPPYKSEEFNRVVHDLEQFKATPIYQHAVASGLIVNDEWAGFDPPQRDIEEPEDEDPYDTLAAAMSGLSAVQGVEFNAEEDLAAESGDE